MAANSLVSSTTVGLPTPPSPAPAARRSTVPSAPKLRDSCHACASSKVKCHKEKPSCSRCVKRGLKCEYVVTKRGGRKHEHRQNSLGGSKPSPRANTGIHTIPLSPTLSSWFNPLDPSLSAMDYLPSPSTVHPSHVTTTSGTSSKLFPGLLSPMGDDSLSSVLTDLPTDLDDFFASPVPFSIPETADSDLLGNHFTTGVDTISSTSGSSTHSTTNILDTFSLFDDALSEPPTSASNPQSPRHSRASPCSDAQSLSSAYLPSATVAAPATLDRLDGPCSCLGRALGLMQQLFPQPPPSSCTSSASSTPAAAGAASEAQGSHLPTIQSVMAKNRHTIEEVTSMLQCVCAKDSYLLAIMSLIVFKVLAWYGAAARIAPASHRSASRDDGVTASLWTAAGASIEEQVVLGEAVVGSYCLHGEDSARMAAQLVLSELHRAQRLVNELSARLKLQAAKYGDVVDMLNGLSSSTMDIDTAYPFSGMMLNQLELDLRKRLRGLSIELREGLKRD